jgi:16S rRNA processing protein RimM
VRGWVRVSSYTDPIDNLLQYQPWLVAGNALNPTTIRPHQGGFVAQLAQVDDRDAAALLAGQDILVPLSELPITDAGEFYWRDLIGMQARCPAGRSLGTVTQVLETGAHDVLVITTQAKLEVLVPFVNEFVHDVDNKEKYLVVDWPEFD